MSYPILPQQQSQTSLVPAVTKDSCILQGLPVTYRLHAPMVLLFLFLDALLPLILNPIHQRHLLLLLTIIIIMVIGVLQNILR